MVCGYARWDPAAGAKNEVQGRRGLRCEAGRSVSVITCGRGVRRAGKRANGGSGPTRAAYQAGVRARVVRVQSTGTRGVESGCPSPSPSSSRDADADADAGSSLINPAAALRSGSLRRVTSTRGRSAAISLASGSCGCFDVRWLFPRVDGCSRVVRLELVR